MAATTKAQRMAAIKKRGEAERAAMASDMAAFEARMAETNKQIEEKNRRRDEAANKTAVPVIEPKQKAPTPTPAGKVTSTAVSSPLSGFGTLIQENNPWGDSPEYEKYVAGLEGTGTFPVSEREFNNRAFKANVKSGYDRHKAGGGQLSYPEYAEGVDRSSLFSTSSNDAQNEKIINRNIIRSELAKINSESNAKGGVKISEKELTMRVESGEIVLPGYKVGRGTPDVITGVKDISSENFGTHTAVPELITGNSLTSEQQQQSNRTYSTAMAPGTVVPTLLNKQQRQQSNRSYTEPMEPLPNVPALDADKTKTVPAIKTLEPVYAPDVTGPDAVVTQTDTTTESIPQTQEMVEQAAADADPSNTGLPGKDSFNPETGEMTNGEGEKVDIDPEEAKGIFEKAASLFGDTFSAADLKRMTLYTVGGLLSGGSMGGSFRWAGMKVMEEQATIKANEAEIEAKEVDFERDLYKLDKQYAQSDKTNAKLHGYSKETAKILDAGRTEAARLIAEASLKDKNAKAKAKVAADAVMAKAVLLAGNSKASALMTAANLKYNRDDKSGQLTGTNTQEWNIEGVDGLDHVTSLQYNVGGGVGKQSWVTFVDPSTKKSRSMPLQAFKRDVIGKLANARMYEGDDSINSNAAISASIEKFGVGLEKDIKSIFVKANEDNDGILASRSAISYWMDRGYAMQKPHQRQIAAQISVLAAKDAASSGNDVSSLAPYMDKAAFSVEAGAPDGGVWATEDGGSVSTVDADKLIARFRKMAISDKTPSGSRANYEAAKSHFENYYTRYSKLKDANGIGTGYSPNEDENEFLLWVNDQLSETVK